MSGCAPTDHRHENKLVPWGDVSNSGHMRPKTTSVKYPKPSLPPLKVREASVAPNPPPLAEVSVRAAKDGLSALLERAAAGEQIVITSDGRPKAMLVRYRPVITGKPWVSLKDFRARTSMTSDSTPRIRAQRDSGY